MFDLRTKSFELFERSRQAAALRQTEAAASFGTRQSEIVGAFEKAADPFVIVALGRVLETHGALADKQRVRFAIALLNEEVVEDGAAEALAALAKVKPDSAAYAWSLEHKARAAARLGRFDDALLAAVECAQRDERLPKDKAFSPRLYAISELRLAASQSWEAMDAFLAAAIDLGARQTAATELRAFLSSPPRWPDSMAMAIAVLRKALSLGLTEDLARILGSVAEGGQADEELLAVGILWLIEVGRLAEAVAIIDARPALAEAERNLILAAGLAKEAAGQYEDAVALLSALSARFDRDIEVWQALSHCTGKLVKATLPARYGPERPSKIFTLFPFYTERTILRIRMEEMADWVDGFVIIEAGETFTGRKKPFHFDTMQPEFAKFAHKMHRVRIDAFPECCKNAWSREFYQRDAAITGLDGIWRPDDVILITDVDEIVDRRAMEGFTGTFAALEMRTFISFLNWAARLGTKAARRKSGLAVRAAEAKALGASYLRIGMSPYLRPHLISNAGWHFTSVGNAAMVADKLQSYSHQEAQSQAFKSVAYNQALLDEIRGGVEYEGWERLDVDERFPRFVQNNQEALAEIILPLRNGLDEG